MAKKGMTFQQKVAKSKRKKHPVCPKCGKERVVYMVIKPYKTEKGSLRFRNTTIRVCACNEKEVFG